MRVILYDLETNGFLNVMTRIHLLVCKVLGEDKKVRVYSDNPKFATHGTIREGWELLATADWLVAHNGIGFDIHALAKKGMKVDPDKHFDTMVAARLLDPERRDNTLEGWGETLKCAKGKYEGDFQTLDAHMVEYAIQDVVVLEKLYEYLRAAFKPWRDEGKQALRIEHEFAWVIALTIQNGFGLDVNAARKLVAEYNQEKHEVAEKLIATFGPLYVPAGGLVPKRDDPKRDRVEGAALTKVKLVDFNPGSRDHIATKLKNKYGWKPRVYTEGGSPKIDEGVIAGMTYPEAKMLARYFKLDKLLGQLDGEKRGNGSGGGWLQHVDEFGIVRGYINSCGAVTGRCTHSKPNIAQADKAPPMRACWRPTRPGWVLMGCDAEGLELRGLGHFLGYYDGGTYAKSVVEGKKENGTDPHSLTQKIVGLFKRDSAKTLIYALVYGAGDEKLGKIIRQDAVDANQPVPKGTLKALGAAARAKVETGIVGFGKLKRAVLNKVRLDGWIGGLDGRRLHVRSPHAALNTLLQSAGAVIMKKAAALFYAKHKKTYGAEWAFCANVHDEVQIEAKTRAIAETLGKSFADCIRLAGEHFKLRCPFAGAYDIGTNWSETH